MANDNSATTPEAEYQYSRRLQLARQKARQKAQKKKKGTVEGISNIKDTYKKIQQAIDVIKLISAGFSSCGEIFVSAPIFILIAHGEWFYSSFINPKYEIPWWKKMLVIIADLIILVVLLIVIVFISMIADFASQSTWEQFKTIWSIGPLKIIWDIIWS